MKKIFSVLAGLLCLAMTVPALADEAPGYGVTIGGRIRADMGWQINSKEHQWGNKSGSSITNFFATVNTNSYLRALFTSADKTTGAHIEFGIGSYINRNNNGEAGADSVALRFGYGWWKIGSCKLLVGQFAGRLGDRYLPGNNLGHTKSGKTDLMGFGFIGGTRNPKIALQMDVNENFGFEIALGQAGSEATDIDMYSEAVRGVASTSSYLPRLEVVLDFKLGDFMLSPGAGISYNKFDISDPYSNVDDYSLSYLLWLPLRYKSGPFNFVINGFYGQNTDTDWTGEQNTNWSDSGMPKSGRHYAGQPGVLPMLKGDDIEDSKYWGAGFGFGYTFTDTVSVKTGAGFANIKNDAWDVNGGKDNYTRWGAFISLPYKVSSNFTVSPEVAYYNYGDVVGVDTTGREDEAGDEWLIGVNFQFLF